MSSLCDLPLNRNRHSPINGGGRIMDLRQYFDLISFGSQAAREHR